LEAGPERRGGTVRSGREKLRPIAERGMKKNIRAKKQGGEGREAKELSRSRLRSGVQNLSMPKERKISRLPAGLKVWVAIIERDRSLCGRKKRRSLSI